MLVTLAVAKAEGWLPTSPALSGSPSVAGKLPGLAGTGRGSVPYTNQRSTCVPPPKCPAFLKLCFCSLEIPEFQRWR